MQPHRREGGPRSAPLRDTPIKLLYHHAAGQSIVIRDNTGSLSKRTQLTTRQAFMANADLPDPVLQANIDMSIHAVAGQWRK